MSTLLILAWLNASFRILKAMRPHCAGQAQSSMLVFIHPGEWFYGDKREPVGTGSLRDLCCPAQISPLGKAELHQFRGLPHQPEAHEPHERTQVEVRSPILSVCHKRSFRSQRKASFPFLSSSVTSLCKEGHVSQAGVYFYQQYRCFCSCARFH